jgi:hypothetical protein
MIKALNLIGNILFACLFIYLTSCASYRYKANVGNSKTPTLSDGWSKLDYSNYLVVHSGSQMMELYDVSFDEKEKIVSGKLKPFVGTPLEYYNNIPDKSRNKKQGRVSSINDKVAVKQIHFMLKDDFDLSSDEISFQLEEITNVALTKSELPTGGTVGVIIAIALAVVLVIGSLSWFNLLNDLGA